MDLLSIYHKYLPRLDAFCTAIGALVDQALATNLSLGKIQVHFGRVFMLNTLAQRILLHIWIILVILKHHLVQNWSSRWTYRVFMITFRRD